MFKYWHLTLLYSLLYVINLVFVLFVVLSLPRKKIIHTNVLLDNHFWLFFSVIVLAGLPPFSFFFFKIYILNSAKTTYFNVFIFYVINTAVLYYYINFLSFTTFKFMNSIVLDNINGNKNNVLIQNKLVFKKSLFFWWGYLNLFFFLFFEYINNILISLYV